MGHLKWCCCFGGVPHLRRAVKQLKNSSRGTSMQLSSRRPAIGTMISRGGRRAARVSILAGVLVWSTSSMAQSGGAASWDDSQRLRPYVIEEAPAETETSRKPRRPVAGQNGTLPPRGTRCLRRVVCAAPDSGRGSGEARLRRGLRGGTPARHSGEALARTGPRPRLARSNEAGGRPCRTMRSL